MAKPVKTILLLLLLTWTPQQSVSSGWDRFYRATYPEASCCYPAASPEVYTTTKAPCVPCKAPPKKVCCYTVPKVQSPCLPCPVVTTTPPPPPPPVKVIYKPICEPPKCSCTPPACPSQEAAQQAAEIEAIIKGGTQNAVKVTSYATAPVVYVAERISFGADMLPMLFAAGGSMLGSAIATPIQFFNTIGSGLISGAISQVITVPISLGTTVKASIVALRPYLSWFNFGNSKEDPCCPKPVSSEPTGPGIAQILLKPIGIIGGGTHLALGSFIGIGGTTFRLIGTLVKSGGELAESTGYGLKTTGALKVANGISDISTFLGSFNQGPEVQTICIEEKNEGAVYQHFYQVETKPIYNEPQSYKPPVESKQPVILPETSKKPEKKD